MVSRQSFAATIISRISLSILRPKRHLAFGRDSVRYATLAQRTSRCETDYTAFAEETLTAPANISGPNTTSPVLPRTPQQSALSDVNEVLLESAAHGRQTAHVTPDLADCMGHYGMWPDFRSAAFFGQCDA